MDVNLTVFLAEFRSEMVEYLQALNEQLLRWERTPYDVTPIREMFLAAHTIKGAAAMMELRDVVALTHALEDVLSRFRSEQQLLDGTTADLLFQTLDLLTTLIERSEPGATLIDPAAATLIGALSAIGTTMAAPSEHPRVLLIEHSPTLRMLEEMMLTDAGFEVDAVLDSEQALNLVHLRRYDLVVTAVETTGLRGLDLAAAIRAMPQWQAVPIILLSSDPHPEHQQRATELGVQTYLRKRLPSDPGLGKMAHALLASRGNL